MLSPFADYSSINRLVSAAENVPPAHKPWSFWIRADDRIELRARVGEQATLDSENWYKPTIVHPLWRELVISSGAALFNLRLAIRVTVHDVATWLLPDPEADPLLLASVEIVTGRIRRPSIAVQEMYDAISKPRVLRDPARARHVRDNILAAMVVASFAQLGWLRVLGKSRARKWLREVTSAESELANNDMYRDELRRWTGDDAWEFGVPAADVGSWTDGPPAWKFRLARTDKRLAERFGSHPQLMTLSTRADRPLDWLRAGQAMEHAMLIGARYGIAASFLTQPLELADMQATRAGTWPKREWPWTWLVSEVPQMVMQVGPAVPAPADERTPGQRFPDVLDMRTDPPRPVLPRLEPVAAA